MNDNAVKGRGRRLVGGTIHPVSMLGPAMATLQRRYERTEETTALLLTPRDDIAHEQADSDTTFSLASGPFRSYQRTVEVLPEALVERTIFRLAIPWFGWLFVPFVWFSLRRPPGPNRFSGKQPVWAPPSRLDERSGMILGLLAAASLVVGYLNTLFTQTVAITQTEFGFSNSAQGVAGVVVRMGIIVALPFVFNADRRGRKRMVIVCATSGLLLTSLGAAAPNLAWLTATQTLGRPLGLALDILITVIAAEEMPRGARAYAVSVMTMAVGLGAGFCVMALPLADLGTRAWRLLYVLPLLLLFVVVDLSRRLPESRRFEAPHAAPTPVLNRRLALVASVYFFSNMFVAPASFFQNRYLRDIRSYDAKHVALFTLITGTPAGLGLFLGGRLAETRGRRVIAIVGIIGGTVASLGSYRVGGWPMWVLAFLGGFVAGSGFPAIHVYQSELFPTSNRGRAGGLIVASALVGGSIGLLATGALLDAKHGYGSSMLVPAVGAMIATAIIWFTFPETARKELEELNPEDAIGEYRVL
jgi:MFS family permease